MKANGGFLERICKKVRRKRDHGKKGQRNKKLASGLERQSSVEQRQLEDTITQSNPGPAQLHDCRNGSLSRGAFLAPNQPASAPSTADASTTTRSCSLPTARRPQLSSPPPPPPPPAGLSAPSALFSSAKNSHRQEPSMRIPRQECDRSHTSTNPALKDLYMLSATDSGLYSEEEGSASEEEYLDVFSDEDGEREEDEEDGVIVGDGWVIPAQEVSLDKMVVSNSCETIYRWALEIATVQL